ncbi:MAG: hypothetical protein ACLU5I_05580 [Alistipes finegoldii]
MKTKRRKILLLCMQVLLPVVPGLWTVLFRPENSGAFARMLVTWMLCLNLLFILIYWRRLGWSRSSGWTRPCCWCCSASFRCPAIGCSTACLTVVCGFRSHSIA